MARLLPYEGDLPYVFVSYSHRNTDAAQQIIARMIEAGYRVWYDEGIDPGTPYDDVISAHVEGCGYFLALMSKEYLDSKYCQNELYYALNSAKPPVLVYLEDVELPSGLKMRLSRIQAIHKYTCPDEEAFCAKLFRTHGLQVCLGKASSPQACIVASSQSDLSITQTHRQHTTEEKEKNTSKNSIFLRLPAIITTLKARYDMRHEKCDENGFLLFLSTIITWLKDWRNMHRYDDEYDLDCLDAPTTSIPDESTYIGFFPTNNLSHLSSSPIEIDMSKEYTLSSLIDALQLHPYLSLKNIVHGVAVTRLELFSKRELRTQELVEEINCLAPTQFIRIEPSPLPSVITVEVPRQQRSSITLREVLESDEMRYSDALLPLALGQAITGVPIISDLAKMPHILLAGSNYSEETTMCLHTMINSLLYHCSCEQLRLILIDRQYPKSRYSDHSIFDPYIGIPHLLAPVFTDITKASNALAWALDSMKNRYRLFREAGVQNIDSYNEQVHDERKLPRIVIVICELHKIIRCYDPDVDNEDLLRLLVEQAGLTGIHLIVATTDLSLHNIHHTHIHTCFQSRIAFKAPSVAISHTVLNCNGAEKLIGNGDMLYLPNGTPSPIRVQGCIINTWEIAKITDYLREHPQS